MGQPDFEFSTSSTDGCPTPTSSTRADATFTNEKDADSLFSTCSHMEHHPIANRPCMIRTKQAPHRYLILVDGKLRLVGSDEIRGGWLWHCLKNRGWYGFRNTASGTYLGHDGCNDWCSSKAKLLANASHHKIDEHFMPDRQINGGYTLLARKGDRLLPVVLSESDSLKLGPAEEKNGTAWEFIDTKFISTYIEVTSDAE
ncbi:hypothetical protein TGAM01_v203685 [Trichoderma gamsii]|uniref:Uncharacterized protein n=1 Tax=Trichoderma gamsii TaxID=398673 RepID=A0A2P4ZSN2_9HYPO|nr:hypothetical protein TGAM01_v203685 [Trichoderma gamsii]PON27304.1 hypothetical protein TGAM01_v203685 [Trichoderma gamsii]